MHGDKETSETNELEIVGYVQFGGVTYALPAGSSREIRLDELVPLTPPLSELVVTYSDEPNHD